MKMTAKKVFLDIQKEEDWLNEQGENGLMLTGYHGGNYTFEDVSPVKFQYKIDLPSHSGSRKQAYFDFLEQTGISVVAEYGGRVYLRKNTADGPLDLYTGKQEIAREVRKRYTHYFITGISQFLLGLYLLVQTLHSIQERSVPFWFVVAVDVGLMISGMIFFVLWLRKHRKYAMSKDEKDIWEA